jgi:hypothetical protein
MKKKTLKIRNFVAKDLRTAKYSHKRHRTAKDFVRSLEKNKIRKEIEQNDSQYQRFS